MAFRRFAHRSVLPAAIDSRGAAPWLRREALASPPAAASWPISRPDVAKRAGDIPLSYMLARMKKRALSDFGTRG